jgi:hypothetical protein
MHKEETAKVFSDELTLCKEMVELLPYRLKSPSLSQ